MLNLLAWPQPPDVERIAESAEIALQWLKDRMGAYPHDTIRIFEGTSPRAQGVLGAYHTAPWLGIPKVHANRPDRYAMGRSGSC